MVILQVMQGLAKSIAWDEGVTCLIEARRPFILNSLPKLVRLLSSSVEGLERGTRIRVGGMEKGSGIIHPNMATMLGVVTTMPQLQLTSDV
nr:Arginine biosynthesis bifunctional protein ArgJ, chloroplastic [Ipomoea batatas]GMC87166.1 Arginine biosynthesis bifunctional protein ArgJ, chloroplastic [Ipomoea batatas]